MAENILKKRIILASASPRRKEILAGMGAEFTVFCADADESSDIKDPETLTRELATRKALAALSLLEKQGKCDDVAVIASDTVVACGDEILGKPKDRDDAIRMIEMLSGNEHTVVTGVAVAYRGEIMTDCSVTRVFVDKIPECEVKKYVDSGEPYDKAGAYGIQGKFGKWVKKIDGCYFGVVGLPANTLANLFYRCVGCYPDEFR